MHRWMYCTAQSCVLSRQICHSCENARNDTGRSTAWGERWWKCALECFTRQTIIDALFTTIMCHLTSSPVSQHCTLLDWPADYADRLKMCHTQSPQTDWDSASPERYAWTSMCGFKEPQTSLNSSSLKWIQCILWPYVMAQAQRMYKRYIWFKRFEQQYPHMELSIHLLFVTFFYGSKKEKKRFKKSRGHLCPKT